jgi:Uma2 family endonuclease
MAVQFVQPRRFGPAEHHRMSEAGVIPRRGTELRDGVVFRDGAPFCFTVEEYNRLGEVGILGEDDRVELIDGEIIEMSPTGSPHSSCVVRLNRLLSRGARDFMVRVQDPLVLGRKYEPVPDLALVWERADYYRASHPTAADTRLVVEVADTSILYDRNVKTGYYAEAGIPEFWLVDLNRGTVIVHLAPAGGGYTDVREYAAGESWFCDVLDAGTLAVDDVLGPAGS